MQIACLSLILPCPCLVYKDNNFTYMKLKKFKCSKDAVGMF